MISITHLHPMLVHFPIALVLFGFLAELSSLVIKKEVCLTKAGLYLLLSGTITALIALLSGAFLTDEMSGAAGEIKETHELLAWISLSILIVVSLIRIFLIINKNDKKIYKWLALGLYGLAAISISLTGAYGGTLVYNFMMPL